MLRALRAQPLVRVTERDTDIPGADAVEGLCDIREQLDASLAHAPREGERGDHG